MRLLVVKWVWRYEEGLKIWSIVAIFRIEERKLIIQLSFQLIRHPFFSIPRIHCDSLNVITYLLTDPWHFERVSLTFSTSHDTKATIERRSINKDRLSYGRSFIFPLLESLFHPAERIRNVTMARNVPIATSCSFVENKKKKRKEKEERNIREREREREREDCNTLSAGIDVLSTDGGCTFACNLRPRGVIDAARAFQSNMHRRCYRIRQSKKRGELNSR